LSLQVQVGDRIAIEIVDYGQDLILEPLIGRDADVTEH
jgi:hypothetical protein